MIKKLKNIKKVLIALAVTILMTVLFIGCLPSGLKMSDNTVDLMRGVIPNQVEATNLSNDFISTAANFSLDLFRKTVQEEENTLISATSVLLALAMTANGARENTLTQMEQVLGGLPTPTLNRYMHSFTNSLYSGNRSQLDIANSIWFRDHILYVAPDFLQTNADYFGANAYSAPFDQTTINDINAWVRYHTNGMIQGIVEEICYESMMFLINTIMFNAEWARIYERSDINQGIFTTFDGREQATTFMTSGGFTPERYFIEDELATGFIKPYHGGHYSFIALLPNEGVCIMYYAASLTGEGFINTIQAVQTMNVFARIPKFEFEFDLSLVDALESLGMKDVFCEETANLRGIGHTPWGDLWIGDVNHSTFISVNERGTRAGAATSVDVEGPASAPYFDREVILDRPFVFAIIDNATSLPIFIGTLLEV